MRASAKATSSLASLVLCLVCLVVPQAASAGTVSVSGSILAYDAAAGETNNVTFRCAATECFVADASAPVLAGPGCEPSGTEQRCAAAGFSAIQVALGDGDDAVSHDPISAAQLPTDAFGEDGADRLMGSSEGDLIDGGLGNDIVQGGAGNDSLRGGCGNDRLFGDEDADTISGNDSSGPGSITVCRSEAGGTESDDDLLVGRAGDDNLFDSAGRNRFHGDDGNDNMRGVVDAAPKKSVAAGGNGRDRMIISGSGLVRARDGFRDKVVCDGNNLNVLADRTLDKVGGTCPDANKFR